MAKETSFTGFSIGHSFTVQPSDSLKISADTNNTKGVKWVWLVPLTTGTFVAYDINGAIMPSITIAAKDLNVCFPIPVTQVKATGTTATFIGVYPGN